MNSLVKSSAPAKIIFLILSCFLSVPVAAQQLTDFNVPAGYTKIMEVKGDLDKDGVEEIVYAYTTDKKVENLGFQRLFYICKVVNGKVMLWKKNTSVLRSSTDCGFCLDKGIDLSIEIKNNTLIIRQTFNHNARHDSTHKNIFRYQKGDWFLIGSTFTDYDTCYFDFQYDINFSTKQVNVAETYGDCDDGREVMKDEFYDFKYPFSGIPKMDGFKPGQVELRIPGSKKYFYY
ncbi:hypothetical protein ACSBL2_09655 [Pedobacter sp. AW31-3R]|uniref:hypothetical protein n=1 Tax=Pedobacter sp. AW31-3R TaxID=3445781 RepID=UPI003F9F6B8A